MLSTDQSGKIAEYFLTCAILSASSGRLSPFLPASDDHGVDLIVMDTNTTEMVGVQVKSWRTSFEGDRKTVQFDVRKATYASTSRVLLAALVIDPQSMSMEVGWLIPMDQVPAIAVQKEQKFALSPSRSLNSNDRYSSFRHMSVGTMIGAISDMVSKP